ncbi:MAG: hypothetical protein AB7T06_47875 [Kofleriaceae bacterium]
MATKTTTGMRLGLGDLAGAGGRALSKYTGMLFSVFIVQSLVAGACILAVWALLANAFAHLPMFDLAVDGDLATLIAAFRYAEPSFLAIAGVVFGTIVIWETITWFCAGGIYGVLAQRPETRAETARVFGASGVATYLAYARLAVCSMFGWSIVFAVFNFFAAKVLVPRLDHALTVGDLAGPLVLTFLPAGILLHYFWTVTDYARAELTLRHESHSPGVVATYLRTLIYVARRPLTLVHGAFGWLLAILVTLAYAFLAQGHPMYGAEGAIMLFIVRQCVALIRMAIRMGVMGGQLELARTRPHPPRRVEPTDEPAPT